MTELDSIIIANRLVLCCRRIETGRSVFESIVVFVSQVLVGKWSEGKVSKILLQLVDDFAYVSDRTRPKIKN